MSAALLPLLLGGGSLLGGLFGGKDERPTIDPAMLRELFGPNALAGDTNSLYKLLLNSPAFSQMMQQASLQGARTSNATQARLAQSGRSGTPYGAFLGAASRGYGQSMQRQGKANLFSQALQQANQGLQNQQSIWANSQLKRQETPTFQRMVGGSLFNIGANMFSNPSLFGQKS